MAEDQKTLWVGNLDEKVTEELLYELFLQTGPIERLILPTEGEKDEEKHKGHAYIVFKHAESVQYAAQVLDGSSLFSQELSLKARSLPIQYKKATPQPTSTFSSSNRGGRFDRYDNSSLRGGFSFNKSNTWHGQNNSFAPRGRGGYNNRGRGGYDGNYNSGYNNYQNQQMNSNFSNTSSYSSMDDKRQRLMQQQNLTLEAHQQIQQGVMNMANQMFNSQQSQQQQQQWSNTNNMGYNTNAGNWNYQGNMMDQSNMYQGYTDQYGNWYQSQ